MHSKLGIAHYGITVGDAYHLLQHNVDLPYDLMPATKPRSLAELEARKQALKDAAAAEIAAVRKATGDKIAALKTSERKLRAEGIRDLKKRQNHAKILVGVAMIYQCQSSDVSSARFRAYLEEFFADSPARLTAAFEGLSLIVRKPTSDKEKDL